MNEALTIAILELAERAGDGGVSMGKIVDALERAGHDPQAVEHAIWELLGRRRLTPCGYVCRTFRRNGRGGPHQARSYEFMLMPWSAHLDAQLELNLEQPK